MITPSNLTDNQFSNVDGGLDPELYKRLTSLAWKLAWENDNPRHNLMEAEEIFAGLMEEMVKGSKRYGHLPKKEQEYVIKRMMDNYIADLKYKYYITYRKDEMKAASIEDDDSVDGYAGDTPDPASIFSSMSRVTDTRKGLSSNAKAVFDAVVLSKGDNGRLTTIMKLHMMRLYSTFENPTVKLEPWMVAEALAMDLKEVQQAFAEIRQAYRKVLVGEE